MAGVELKEERSRCNGFYNLKFLTLSLMLDVAFWRNTFYHEKTFKGYINCSSGWAGPSKEARPPASDSLRGEHTCLP